jgi:CRP-like cAMP-binding protein
VAKKKSEHLHQLRNVPLFAGCSDRELKKIGESVKEVHFPAGRVICEEGEQGGGLHVVVEGDTKVEVNGRTRRRMGPGSFFGEIALLDGGARTATVIAESDVTTLSLPMWSFKSVLKEHPTMALKMLEEVGRRLRATEKSLSH